jgi:hypothetical protein
VLKAAVATRLEAPGLSGFCLDGLREIKKNLTHFFSGTGDSKFEGLAERKV